MSAVENIIAAGRELIAAKEALPHGEFLPLLRELNLSRQSVEQFMRVARNEVILNRQPVGGLPASVSVLDVLTQLDDDELNVAIESGDVHATTTRKAAKQLVADRHGHADQEVPAEQRMVDDPEPDLDKIEGLLAGGMPWFMVVAIELQRIRVTRIYRSVGCSSFGEYLRTRWSLAPAAALRIIEILDETEILFENVPAEVVS